MIRLGNNEVLKTLIFVDADANATADAGGSTIALPERCSGELTKLLSLLKLPKVLKRVTLTLRSRAEARSGGGGGVVTSYIWHSTDVHAE